MGLPHRGPPHREARPPRSRAPARHRGEARGAAPLARTAPRAPHARPRRDPRPRDPASHLARQPGRHRPRPARPGLGRPHRDRTSARGSRGGPRVHRALPRARRTRRVRAALLGSPQDAARPRASDVSHAEGDAHASTPPGTRPRGADHDTRGALRRAAPGGAARLACGRSRRGALPPRARPRSGDAALLDLHPDLRLHPRRAPPGACEGATLRLGAPGGAAGIPRRQGKARRGPGGHRAPHPLLLPQEEAPSGGSKPRPPAKLRRPDLVRLRPVSPPAARSASAGGSWSTSARTASGSRTCTSTTASCRSTLLGISSPADRQARDELQVAGLLSLVRPPCRSSTSATGSAPGPPGPPSGACGGPTPTPGPSFRPSSASTPAGTRVKPLFSQGIPRFRLTP